MSANAGRQGASAVAAGPAGANTRRVRAVRPRRAPRALLAAAALGPALVLLPVALTFWRALSFGAADAVELLWRPLVGELLVNTLAITVAGTISSAIVGTALAWFVERTDLPGRRGWALLAAAPLAMPAFVTSYAWVSLSLDLQDFAGALLVITTAYFPLVYLPVAAALRGLDPSLEECARVLGCSRWTTFTRVVLPQLRPALFGSMLLVALGVMSEFGAFALLRFRTFTTEIYAEYRTSFDGGGASLLASVLIVLCLACVVVEFRVRGSARYARIDRGVRRAPLRHALGRWRWPAAAGFAALNVVTLGVPLAMIGYWLTQPGAAAVTVADVSPALLLSTTFASLWLGLLAACVTTLLALPLAYLLTHYPGRLATFAERTAFLSQGVPGLVIGLAIVSLAVRALQPLYQGTTLLIAAYAILFLPLALVSVRAALLQSQQRLEDTARSLGLSRLATLRRVVMPLASPGLGAAAAMVFISVVTELNATLLLVPIGTRTLAMQVWADTTTLAFAAAAPYAALLTGLSLAGSGLLFAFAGRSALARGVSRGPGPG
ncbi:ABC transporter permease [Paraburkholderia caballeronis]|uniref:Iron(III) transport system permease protein n=1 Tax=Paraburkholderia caballeronis TaxID=416943 RepID=A0A1H7WBU9_9BURK|nr:iron ABC transporter permease [Paraburkholderia caballeronis]PXW13591.1 iron(III) transport system permease protein [Paraburkholderia caballeronis]PXW92385.1 iron(III) transport system permease protein [Paraburkholderia caballeronis]RAJ86589.1 iron(III) transport system permease protein [Paraburkholderia caballeronis]SEE63952.1 iron(III) transport system permease protein [Paraburkholderia caballeronis]SEM18814.1 iron(III) transport system permease protein [Paraburkholderia caballeronis]